MFASTRTNKPAASSFATGDAGSASGPAAEVVPTPPEEARVSNTLRSRAGSAFSASAAPAGRLSVTRQPGGSAVSVPGEIRSSSSGP